MNAELCSPGPATPIQVVPLPQQKPREASKSCPNTATIRVMHPFEAAKSSCEPQLASETLKSVPASTQVCTSFCLAYCEDYVFFVYT